MSRCVRITHIHFLSGPLSASVCRIYNVMQRAFLNIQNRWIFLKLSVLVTHIHNENIQRRTSSAHRGVKVNLFTRPASDFNPPN
jgi:hypothetical protein